MKILIVEDEALISKALQFRLKKDGHETKAVSNGPEGLQCLINNRYDLVITDICLPGQYSFAILNAARQNTLNPVPVIVLSSDGCENEVLEAFRLGADDYINKPFSPWELSLRIKRLNPEKTAAANLNAQA